MCTHARVHALFRNSPTPTIPSLSSFFHPYSQITHGQCLQPPLGRSFQRWRRKDIDMGVGGAKAGELKVSGIKQSQWQFQNSSRTGLRFSNLFAQKHLKLHLIRLSRCHLYQRKRVLRQKRGCYLPGWVLHQCFSTFIYIFYIHQQLFIKTVKIHLYPHLMLGIQI